MTRRYAALLLLVGTTATLEAQETTRRPTRTPLVEAAPSRADSLLGRGRLRAAEDALYAAVAAAPRASAPRGALGRYIASRGRFPIAQVLYEEAQRFGADPAIVARAIAQMAPYRPVEAKAGTPPAPPVTVSFAFSEDGRALGRFTATGRGGRSVAVTLDPKVTGVAVHSLTDSLLEVRRSGRGPRMATLTIGERKFDGIELTVDTTIVAGEARVGIDLLWRHGFAFDERDGTLTLGGAGVRSDATVTYVPVVLSFPGLLLVPRPGPVPLPVEGARGRDLLRGKRWWLDAAQGALVVQR